MGRTLCSQQSAESSQQYIKLKKRIQQLERHYLSESCDVSDEFYELSEWQQDDIRSFILLSHAEIEYYLEEIASMLCEEVDRRIQSGKYTGVSMWFIFHVALSKKIDCPRSQDLISKASRGYLQYYKNKLVFANNGIKTEHIERLFSPFFDIHQVDSDWLAELDTLGTKRGECAHRGSLGIASTYNASETRTAIESVVKGLGTFDDMISQLIMKLDGNSDTAALVE